MSRKQSVRSRPGKKAELERKRDERAARRALAKERRNRAGEEAADPQEFLSFANQLRVLGLRLREVPGDGNCLFRALGDQLEGHSRDHLRHRQETADYMVKHRHDFEPFVEDDVPFDRHVENLAQPGTFAGNDAIVAFARNNQVNVVIHQLNNPLWQIRGSDKGNARELHIAYRYGEHYDSVRSGQDNTESPAHLQTEMFSKDVSNRKNKPKSDVPEERAERREDAVQKVRNATGCADARLILQSLEAERYDIEAAIQMVLQIEQLKQIGDADCVAEGSDCSYSSATWEPSDCEGSETQRRTPTPHREPPEHRKQSRQSRSEDDTQEQNKKNSNQKVSNKQRKDQQRLEKKKRQEERHRQKVQDQRGNNTDNNRQGDGDAVTVVKALSTLTI